MIEKNLLDRLGDSKVLHQISGKKYHIRAIRDIGVKIGLDKNRNIDIGHKGHNFVEPFSYSLFRSKMSKRAILR